MFCAVGSWCHLSARRRRLRSISRNRNHQLTQNPVFCAVSAGGFIGAAAPLNPAYCDNPASVTAACCFFASARRARVPLAPPVGAGLLFASGCGGRRFALRVPAFGAGSPAVPVGLLGSASRLLGVRARASGRSVSGRSGSRLLAVASVVAPGLRPPCGFSLRLARGSSLFRWFSSVLLLVASPLVAANSWVPVCRRGCRRSDKRSQF